MSRKATGKARVTVTVDRDLLRAAEKRAAGRSRSYVVEQALREAERLAVVRETIAYYKARGPGEIAAAAAAMSEDE